MYRRLNGLIQHFEDQCAIPIPSRPAMRWLYAQQFGGLDDPSELVSAQEVGDGNLNLVFKIFDAQGVSRIIVEAGAALRALQRRILAADPRPRAPRSTDLVAQQHSPQHTVHIIHFDPALAVMVMEDLSDHRIWRGELIGNVYYPQAAGQLGEYLAQTLFHTSDFYLHPHEKKAQVAQFINPEMCEITEDLVFNDPYQIHERNNYPAELEEEVAAPREDAQLKLAVAALKHRFSHRPKPCCMAIFIAAPSSLLKIALKPSMPNLADFGPIGFDVGTAIGNLLV